MNKQSGFTLIELMIVIAILGILLAIAIPAYQDYTIRSKVAEGLMLGTAAKAAVSETRMTSGTWPSTNDEAGFFASPTTTYISGIEVQPNGIVEITYAASAELGPAASTTLLLTPSFNAGRVSWDCNGSKGVGAAGTIPSQYVPSSCREP